MPPRRVFSNAVPAHGFPNSYLLGEIRARRVIERPVFLADKTIDLDWLAHSGFREHETSALPDSQFGRRGRKVKKGPNRVVRPVVVTGQRTSVNCSTPSHVVEENFPASCDGTTPTVGASASRRLGSCLWKTFDPQRLEIVPTPGFYCVSPDLFRDLCSSIGDQRIACGALQSVDVGRLVRPTRAIVVLLDCCRTRSHQSPIQGEVAARSLWEATATKVPFP